MAWGFCQHVYCTTLVLMGLVLFGTVAAAARPQPTPQLGSETQYVVLKSGSVFAGSLEMGDGRFVVRQASGATVQFSRKEVDFVANSLYEAYHKLKLRLSLFDETGHEQLARWCLKNRAIQAATEQIRYYASIAQDPRDTRMLQRQLESLQQSLAVKGTPSERPIRKQSAKTTGPRTSDSYRELQLLVDSMSRESLKEFNSNVHPRLIHGCAAANCHAQSSSTLRLWPSGLRGGLKSTAGKRNLQAVMQFIDARNVGNSPLLTYATTPHGGVDHPPYAKNSAHYQVIHRWVVSAGRHSRRLHVAAHESGSDVRPASYVQDGQRERERRAPSDDGDKLEPIVEIPSPANLTQDHVGFTPRDEFDPEIFNRLQRAAIQAAALAPPKLFPDPPEKPQRVRQLPPTDDR